MGADVIVTALFGSGGVAATIKWLFLPAIKRKKDQTQKRWKMLEDVHYELQDTGNGSLKTAVVNLQREFKATKEEILWRLDGLEENQNLMLNVQNLSFLIMDEEGMATYASPAQCRLFDRSEQDLLGHNWHTWIIEQDKDRIEKAWQRALNHRSIFDEIFTIRIGQNNKQLIAAITFHKKVKGEHVGTIMRFDPVPQILN